MPFDRFLKQYPWVITATLVGVGAAFTARGLSAALAVGLTNAGPAQAAALSALAPKAGESLATVHATSGQAVLDRNPFDSVTGPIRELPPSEGVLDDSDPMSAPKCDGLRLVSAVYSPDPAWSLAALAQGDVKPFIARRGTEVFGKKVHYINWDRVWLSGGSSLCQVVMFGAQEPGRAAPVPMVAATAVPGGLDPAISGGIKKLSGTEFEVARSAVDKILENQADLMKEARIVPETVDGKVVGVKLFGIRPGKILSSIGLQNGDRLDSINGFDIGSPEKALEAYARLRTAEKIQVKVNRGGQAVVIDYAVK